MKNHPPYLLSFESHKLHIFQSAKNCICLFLNTPRKTVFEKWVSRRSRSNKIFTQVANSDFEITLSFTHHLLLIWVLIDVAFRWVMHACDGQNGLKFTAAATARPLDAEFISEIILFLTLIISYLFLLNAYASQLRLMWHFITKNTVYVIFIGRLAHQT